MDMESGHIETRKLYEAVKQSAVLEQSEIQHLGTCEQCLQMIRILVLQGPPAAKSAAE
jgi:hypothetical protein